MSIIAPNDQIAKRNLIVLIILQTTVGAMIPVHFTLGAIAGKMIAPSATWATLPISMTIIGSMLATGLITRISTIQGRVWAFLFGTLVAVFGTLLAAFSVYSFNFTLLNLGSLLIGFFMSAQGMFRFAATDMASEEFRARAISFSLIGGIGAALVGPTLAGLYSEPNLWLPYLIVAMISLVVSCLYFALKLPAPVQTRTQKVSLKPVLMNPKVQAAMIISITSYAMMNLMMTSTPLAVIGCGFTNADASSVVRAHVLAMFVPSFFTGYLIRFFGVTKVVYTGLVILLAAALVALSDVELSQFYIALILLGVGWNFGFIGGTNMLVSAIQDPASAKQMQGLNDTIMWSLVALASLSSGVLMNFIGDGARGGWNLVNSALIISLSLAMVIGAMRLRKANAIGQS